MGQANTITVTFSDTGKFVVSAVRLAQHIVEATWLKILLVDTFGLSTEAHLGTIVVALNAQIARTRVGRPSPADRIVGSFQAVVLVRLQRRSSAHHCLLTMTIRLEGNGVAKQLQGCNKGKGFEHHGSLSVVG